MNNSAALSLFEAEFYTSFLAHHTLIPGWFEYEVYIGRLDTLYAIHLGAHILKDEVGCRAGWGQ